MCAEPSNSSSARRTVAGDCPFKAECGPDIVIIISPSGNFAPSVSEARKYFLVEQLVAKPPVERFDECILCWFSRLNVMPRNASGVLPFEDGAGG